MERSRPRVLIDALSFHPADGGFATGMRGLLDTCAALDEFEFLVLRHRTLGAELVRPGLVDVPLRFPARGRVAAGLAAVPAMARRLRVDAVHCENSALPAWSGVPGGVTVHDFAFLDDAATTGDRAARRLAIYLYWRRAYVLSLKRARVIKAVSHATAAEASALLGAAAPPVVVAPHRVAAPDSLPGRPPRVDGPLRILWVGSVVPRRNLAFLLDALSRLTRPWHLEVVGAVAVDLASLGPIAADPRVTFHGHVADGVRDALLAVADLLVNPSTDEGFGFPVAEAIAAGVPVMVSDIPAFREYVPAESRFPLDRSSDLTARLEAFAPESVEASRVMAFEAVQQFSAAAHVTAHGHYFRMLTSPRPP